MCVELKLADSDVMLVGIEVEINLTQTSPYFVRHVQLFAALAV